MGPANAAEDHQGVTGVADLLPAGLFDSPPESPPAAQPQPLLPEQLPVSDEERSAVDKFLNLSFLQPEPALLPHLPAHPATAIPQHAQDEQTSQGKDMRRASSRLADKPNAKLHSIARCQTVLMKKLDLMPASQPPKEDHKKRLLGLFSETLSPQAIAAVEDLLSDGNPVVKDADA
jgi:hypothetical protein